MSDLSKPLYSLTVEEYIELNERTFEKVAEKIIDSYREKSNKNNFNNDNIFIDELVALTGYKKSTIYSKISRFEMPCISRRAPLTFSRVAILDWLKNGKPSVIDQEANDYLSKT